MAEMAETGIEPDPLLALETENSLPAEENDPAVQGRLRELGGLIVRITLRSAPLRKRRISTL